MAATDSQPHERSDRSGGRRRPFSTWMKKLTNFKNGSSNTDSNQVNNSKRNGQQTKANSKKQSPAKNNNPYPESGRINGPATASTPGNRHLSFSTVPTGNSMVIHHQRLETKSLALTTGDEHDIARSDIAASHAPSSGEATNAPSVRSLTTTLTTIHSAGAPAATVSHHNASNNTQGIQFTHQFPSSPPATALPAHLAPQDNASILTLASSSKRRRRRSMDTDASVRALAPSSVFGGSRESLPLSVLSATIEGATITSPTALPSERNSYYANKQSLQNDGGGSVKSGLLGHGHTDSISGSIGGIAAPGSPLASPRDPTGSNGKLSRSNSAGWGENGELVITDTDALEVDDTKDKTPRKRRVRSESSNMFYGLSFEGYTIGG
ncbi:hypothetical protein DID88_001033 [Monilinia fructigena]|uniref:Uncharacterized protein n=1 Tax=Monilinia fructigena TaxID=38457 RepID=A0A395IYY2_9HELO|nr:hypothetical protein DID88_001033 [Monilinia fructigena]